MVGIQGSLDGFYYARKWLLDWLTFLSIRIYGIECTFTDVRGRKYNIAKHLELRLEDAKDTDTLLALAKDRFKDSIDRRAFVTDKAKTLITLNSALLAIIAAFLPKVAELSHWSAKAGIFLGVLLMLNALVIMWLYFDIKDETVVVLTQSDVRLASDVLKKSLVNDYLYCQIQTDNVTDFQADLYKTARFFFLSGFLVVFTVFSIGYLAHSSETESDRIVRQVRSDPKLVELLRGPKGERGDQGQIGDKGEIGPRGPQGVIGPQGVQGLQGPPGQQGQRGEKGESAQKQ